MDERVCLVTGVGPGTGSAICRRFAREGFRVAMLARNAERLRELEAELPGARAFPCDVSDEDAVRGTLAAVRDELGAPEVLVYNATRGTFGNFLQSSPKDFETNFRVNALGLLHVAQAVSPAGSGSRGGSGLDRSAAPPGSPRFRRSSGRSGGVPLRSRGGARTPP